MQITTNPDISPSSCQAVMYILNCIFTNCLTIIKSTISYLLEGTEKARILWKKSAKNSGLFKYSVGNEQSRQKCNWIFKQSFKKAEKQKISQKYFLEFAKINWSVKHQWINLSFDDIYCLKKSCSKFVIASLFYFW